MNLSPNDCYLPPIHNPQLISSSKECLQLWNTHRLSLYLLLSQKNHSKYCSTLLGLWLDRYCHFDPLYLSQWFPFTKQNAKKEKGLKEYKIPKHIFLWNDASARLLAQYTTHRWLQPVLPNPPTIESLPKVPYRWKPRDHTTEGLIQRWGSLPEREDLPVVIPFQHYHQWPVPWKLLYRGLITGAYYPHDCFLAYNGWDGGWGWILGWTTWAQRSMGNVASSSIYPMITPGIDPLPHGCPHSSWVGLAIGWQLLEILFQQRQYPEREIQDWIVRQFSLARKVWLSPFLFGSTDTSSKHLTIMYQFMDWVSWFLLCPEEALQSAQSQQDYMKQNEGDIVRDYIQLGQQYHQYACQDRESQLIQTEFISLYERKQQNFQKEKESKQEVIHRRKKQEKEREEEEPNVILDMPGFIPHRGDLVHRKVSTQQDMGIEERILDMRRDKIEKSVHSGIYDGGIEEREQKRVGVELQKQDTVSQQLVSRGDETRALMFYPTIEENDEEGGLDWDALEEIVSRKKSHKPSSEDHYE